ncbi:unnamed protein product [Mucor hiemalis]
MSKENEDIYLQSLKNKSIQEATYSNLTTADFLKEINKKKAADINSVASYSTRPPLNSNTTEEINKKKEEIYQYVCGDSVKINNSHLSVGTIIMRQAMTNHMDYKTLTPSDIALVNCGLNCILFFFYFWLSIQEEKPFPSFSEIRPSLRKIDKVFKNPRDLEECYWNCKSYQQKASNSKEKIGYELIGIIIDKMIKHTTIFINTKPIRSRYNDQGLGGHICSAVLQYRDLYSLG